MVTEYTIAGGSFGLPLDDVWIHFRFAENFAHGYFYQYNPGEPTPGTTSPLWVIVLAVPFLFSQNLILPYALFVSSLFFLLALIQLYKLCVKLGFDGVTSLLITLVTMAAGRLLWSSLSGMEITLFVLLSVLIFSSHLNEITTGKVSLVTGLLLGFAANTRPETYLLAGLYYLTSLFFIRTKLKGNFPKLILSGVVFLILVLPYPLFSYIHTGGFLPNTYEGQVGAAQYLPSFDFINATARMFAKDNFIIFILWGLSTIYFIYSIFKKKIDGNFLLINLWILMLPLVSSIVAPNWRHHGRYLIPLIPFINISAIYILRKLHAIYEAKGYRRYTLFRKGTIAVILIASVNSGVLFAGVLGWNVENINNQQGKIAAWLNQNLPGETAFGMNDIGYITFVTKKYVVDMAGLVTPEVFGFQKMSYEDGTIALFRFLKAKGVNYIIIYPTWFGYIMDHYSGAFTQVHSQKLEKNTICGGIEMMVYKVDWDKIDLNKNIPGQNTK